MRRLPLRLLFGLAAITILATAFGLYRNFAPTLPSQTEVLAYDIIEEGSDFIVIEAEYFYSGEQGRNVLIGAATLKGEERTGRHMFWVEKIFPGHHMAKIELLERPSGPDYCTDGLEFFIYQSTKNHEPLYIFRQNVSFKKCWKQARQ